MNAQTLSIIVAVLAAMAGGGSQLHSFMDPLPNGALIVNTVIGVAGFFGTILAAIVAGMTGQKATIAAVEAMPGTKMVSVDPEKANAKMMEMAASDAHPKVQIVSPT